MSSEEEESAVDETLVAETLKLSPEERLRQNDRTISTILELRRGFAASESDDSPPEVR